MLGLVWVEAGHLLEPPGAPREQLAARTLSHGLVDSFERFAWSWPPSHELCGHFTKRLAQDDCVLINAYCRIIACARLQDALHMASIYKSRLPEPFDQIFDTAQTINLMPVCFCELCVNEIEALIVTYKLELLTVCHFGHFIRLVEAPLISRRTVDVLGMSRLFIHKWKGRRCCKGRTKWGFVMIGQSVPMRRIMSLIERIASSDVPVLITGESGTGKEITAQLVHNLSSRKNGPYLPVNCAAIPETLIESQLFGHERGAFTGADRRHEGLFERACGGTLLLDEITEMRCETQAKLLRVLEEGTVLRVGGTKEIPINVRVLAATNRSIDRALRGGLLRDDLYFRLKVFSVHLPPLRERIEDLPFLIEHFIQRTNEKHGRRITSIHDDCLNALAAYRWPGNIRELKHAIEHAVIVCETTQLVLSDLPSEIKACARPDSSFTIRLGSSMREVVDELICRTVTYAGGNKVRAAKILGVGRGTVYSRLAHYDGFETNGRSNGRLYRNGRDGLT